MRRLILVAVLTVTAVLVGGAPAAAPLSVPAAQVPLHPEDDAWVFSGGGWGHGVGMSQYGAQAMALSGHTVSEILDYYYTNVAMVQRSSLYGSGHLLGQDNPQLWIGLLQDRTSFEFVVGSEGGVDLCQANDGTGDCPKPDATPAAGETWEFARHTGPNGEKLCRFERVSPAPVGAPAAAGSCKASIAWGGAGQAATVEVDGYEYKHGIIRVRQGAEQLTDWNFHVSLVVGLELYLRGLAEVPLSWEPATLQAQVVAGRTYAVATTAARYDASVTPSEPISSTWKDKCYCHLRRTTADQHYTGWTHETAPFASKWVAAVNATTGQVLAQSGAPITAWYSSSTGGVTENSEDVFGSVTGWAKSVPDPWSLDPAAGNPFASWDEPVGESTLESVLGFDSIDLVTLINPSPNASMKVTGSKNGVTVTSDIDIPPLYSSLGLRSPTVTGITFDPGAAGAAFDDIAGLVHEASINRIAELGITKGCNPPANNLFCPTREVTRGQMAAFLTRALNLPPVAKDYFSDDNDSIFEDDINRLAGAGGEIGCGGSSYCPSRAITRSEMALFVVTALGLDGVGESDFVDIAGDPNEGHIRVLADFKITLGCNPPANDRYCPDETVHRAQMATFIVRAIDATAPQ